MGYECGSVVERGRLLAHERLLLALEQRQQPIDVGEEQVREVAAEAVANHYPEHVEVLAVFGNE